MTHDLRGTPMNYFELRGTELKAKRSAQPLYLASLVYTERLDKPCPTFYFSVIVAISITLI